MAAQVVSTSLAVSIVDWQDLLKLYSEVRVNEIEAMPEQAIKIIFGMPYNNVDQSLKNKVVRPFQAKSMNGISRQKGVDTFPLIVLANPKAENPQKIAGTTFFFQLSKINVTVTLWERFFQDIRTKTDEDFNRSSAGRLLINIDQIPIPVDPNFDRQDIVIVPRTTASDVNRVFEGFRGYARFGAGDKVYQVWIRFLKNGQVPKNPTDSLPSPLKMKKGELPKNLVGTLSSPLKPVDEPHVKTPEVSVKEEINVTVPETGSPAIDAQPAPAPAPAPLAPIPTVVVEQPVVTKMEEPKPVELIAPEVLKEPIATPSITPTVVVEQQVAQEPKPVELTPPEVPKELIATPPITSSVVKETVTLNPAPTPVKPVVSVPEPTVKPVAVASVSQGTSVKVLVPSRRITFCQKIWNWLSNNWLVNLFKRLCR